MRGLLNNLGEVAVAAKAGQRLEEAVSLARLLDDRRVLTDALRNLSDLEVQRGDNDRAKKLAEEAREIFQKLGMKKRDEVSRKLDDLTESESPRPPLTKLGVVGDLRRPPAGAS